MTPPKPLLVFPPDAPLQEDPQLHHPGAGAGAGAWGSTVPRINRQKVRSFLQLRTGLINVCLPGGLFYAEIKETNESYLKFSSHSSSESRAECRSANGRHIGRTAPFVPNGFSLQ